MKAAREEGWLELLELEPMRLAHHIAKAVWAPFRKQAKR